MPEDLIAGHLTPWRVWNRGGARPLLALHCSLAHSGAWTGLAGLLSDVTVTALDQPSHGRSADWDGVEDLHGLTTRISVAMAETLADDGRVDLIGHSFGATVALRIALERPDLVRSLVLIEPVIFAAANGGSVYDDFRAGHLGFAELVLAGKRAEAAALFHGVWGTGDDFADLPEKTSRYMRDRIHLIEAQNPVLLDDTAGILRPGALETVAVPVLLIDGADSPSIIEAVHG
ncbi:MAG: alpha/beta fold hydrolase, partial [Paracoccaceae bacterium]